MVGCELGGAVKNVIALACGIAEGLGFGDNTRASLITRGLAETARLGMALGAELTTFAGLAGLGDLVATCSSPLSRNRTFGEKLGRGMSGRGGAGEHPADRRGREELPLGARPGPRARRRRPDHRGRRPGLPRGRGPGRRWCGRSCPARRSRSEPRAVLGGRHPVGPGGGGRRRSRAPRCAPRRCSPRRSTSATSRPRAGGADAYARTEQPTLRDFEARRRRARRRPLPVLRHRDGGDHRRRPRLRRARATAWCCRRTATTRPGCSPPRSWSGSACAVDVRAHPGDRGVRRGRRDWTAPGWCCWRRPATRSSTSATSPPWPGRPGPPARCVAVDNTTATPLGQRPLALGADLTVGSDTKALTGHSDLLLGHVSTTDDELYARLEGLAATGPAARPGRSRRGSATGR